MERPADWIKRVTINGDRMTVDGVTPSKEEEKRIRKSWKEEQQIWNGPKNQKNGKQSE